MGFAEFLTTLTVWELAAVARDLRVYPEDRPWLQQVLLEFKRRDQEPTRAGH